jgi:hypothetical protein
MKEIGVGIGFDGDFDPDFDLDGWLLHNHLSRAVRPD